MISYVITNFNRPEQTRRSLTRLLNFAEKPDEIVVIDNSNNRDTFEAVKKIVHLPMTYCLKRPEKYVGYEGAAIHKNIGFKLAKYEDIIFADSELLPITSVVNQCKTLLTDHVITAGRIYFMGEKTPVNDLIITHPKQMLELLQVVEENKENPRDLTPEEVHATKGWAAYYMMFVKKYWVEEIGGCDEEMKGWGFDDIDFLTRMRIAGHNQTVDNSIEVIHQYHDRSIMTDGKTNADRFFAKKLDETKHFIANEGKEWGVINPEEWEIYTQ